MSSERIQALETQQLNDERARVIDREERAQLLHKVDNIERDVQEMKISLGRQRGYIAGAMSVVVLIWTVVLSAVMVLWDRVVESISGMFP